MRRAARGIRIGAFRGTREFRETREKPSSHLQSGSSESRIPRMASISLKPIHVRKGRLQMNMNRRDVTEASLAATRVLVTVVVNGRSRHMDVDPRTTLLE